jgi:peptide/nickel transport system substrate-binding protein/oligopeptide transport system substrate-binding protein
LGFACDRPPFDDVRLRRAVSHAIDRQKIIDSVLAGSAVAAGGPVPPTILPACNNASVPDYDADAAKRLVTEAGGAPPKTTLYLSSGREELSVCEAVRDYLRKVVFDVDLEMLEWSSFKDAVSRGEPDMFYLSWWADYPDPENFLFPTFHSSNWGSAGNRCRFAAPDVDAAIESAVLETDEETRTADYCRAVKLVVDAAPWVFLWHRRQFVAVQPRVHGFTFFPIHSADRGVTISLEEG